MAKTFIDTNVLFYSVDTQDARKHKTAVEVVGRLAARREATISAQVANEFASNLVKKLGKSPASALGYCQGLRKFDYVPTTLETLGRALLLMQTASLSFWDAAILASTIDAGCSVLLTEDLNHGQTIAGVHIRNPFVDE